MLRAQTIDSVIIILMFALLPVDMINTIVLKNGFTPPISIGQSFKLIILTLLFIRFFLFNFKDLVSSMILFLILLIPSLIQVIIQSDSSFLFFDLVKVSKYSITFVAFLFFKDIIKRQDPLELKKLLKLVRFSYVVLSINILAKYVGLGYPMYHEGNIGSKGFFYAGNETSALLIILTSILGYQILIANKRRLYYVFMLFSMFVGFTISSKTGVLGVLLLFVLMPLERANFRFQLQKLKKIGFTFLIAIPILVGVVWSILKQLPVFNRLSFYWEHLDIWTFILSHRNVFLQESMVVYQTHYTWIEKLLGVGQTKCELLNNGKIIEIDIADIFFSYGYLGLFLFLVCIGFIIIQSWRFSILNVYSYGKLVFLISLILLGVSSIAGHVFNSGMAAIFIGLLFSLMYVKNDVPFEKS